MSTLKEYIVTLKDKNDLDDFYEDMETPGGNLYIPDRRVDCASRRSISRNTHYYLTDEEASQIRQDPRVLCVELLPEEQGMIIRSLYSQTESTWDKSPTNNSAHKNWGLLRVFEAQQRSNWGSNGTASQSGTITVNAEGRNVDVVVVDGHINPDHPEYAVNADGTGGTRVVQYNWFQLNAAVWAANPSATYSYTPYDNGATQFTEDNNHGAHVAGTIVGNTQGWARKSNIYNINPYSTSQNGLSNNIYLIDYIREFHRTKSVNPATGRKNPTICNHSWGYGFRLAISGITGVFFRGSFDSTAPFTEAELNAYGIFTSNISGTISAIAPARYGPVDADMVDAMADGIIMIGAAGNDYTKIDVVGGEDYDNLFIWNSSGVYYHEGSTPGSSGTTIAVGSISSLVNESKSTFSNTGPRVNIFAPGTNIMSSVNSTTSFGGVNDPRNSTYKIAKISGTSMASPQVCGLMACAMEIYPSLTQTQAVQYITTLAKQNQITATTGGFTDYTDLLGSVNRHLAFKQERLESGDIHPKKDYFVRPSQGVLYPRVRKRR
jgi:hypothetical protein